MSRPHILRLLAILAFLACSLPASASITLANKGSTVGGTSSGVAFTIPSTTAGNLVAVLIQMEGTGTGTVTSVTDGGDTFTCPFTSVALTATSRTGAYCYILTGAGGKTSVTVNFTTAAEYIATELEYHSTLGALALGVTNSTNLIGSTATPVGPSVTTTVSSSVITALLVTNNQGATGNLLNTGVTFTLEASPIGAFANMGASDLLNIAAGTYAPKWQMGGADISASIVVSFSEVQRGGTTIF